MHRSSRTTTFAGTSSSTNHPTHHSQSERQRRRNNRKTRTEHDKSVASTHATLQSIAPSTTEPSAEQPSRKRNVRQQRDRDDSTPHGTTPTKTKARREHRLKRNWVRQLMHSGEVRYPTTSDRIADDAGRALACLGYYMREQRLLDSLAGRLELKRTLKPWNSESLFETAKSRADYIYGGRPQWGLASCDHHPMLYRVWRRQDDSVTLLLRHLLGFVQIRENLQDLGFEAPEASAPGAQIQYFWEDLIDAAAGGGGVFVTA